MKVPPHRSRLPLTLLVSAFGLLSLFGAAPAVLKNPRPAPTLMPPVRVLADQPAASPTPFPAIVPSPTATPATAPPNDNPILDAQFRGPRLVQPNTPSRVLVLSSGKFLVFGATDETLMNREAGCIQRYNADGTYDPTFQVTGVRSVNAVIELPNHQLIIAASLPANSPVFSEANTGTNAMEIFRLNEDGSTDSTFANDAIMQGEVDWLTLQPDGNILVAGNFAIYRGNYPGKYIVRLFSSGDVDTSFASQDWAQATDMRYTCAPVVQPDGRIIVAGDFTWAGFTGPPNHSYMLRLMPDGTFDNSFNPSGFSLWFANSGSYNALRRLVRGVALLPNGQIILAGTFIVPASFQSNPTGQTYSYLPLIRLNADGSADQSFGCFEPSLFANMTNFGAHDVVVLADGKLASLITRKHEATNNTDDTTVFGFNSDGTLDHTFVPPVLRNFVPGSADFYVGTPSSLQLESTGTFLVAGAFNAIGDDGVARIGVARLNADGTPTSFAPEIAGTYTYPSTAARFSDGSVWITGTPQYGPGPYNSFVGDPRYSYEPFNAFPHNVARLTSNGSFDFSFDLASSVGNTKITFGGVAPIESEALAWGLDSDAETFSCYKLTANGIRDDSFTFVPSGPGNNFAVATPTADGSILVAAGSDIQATLYGSINRLRSDGSFDPSFMSSQGQVWRDNSGQVDDIFAGNFPLTLTSNGDIISVFVIGEPACPECLTWYVSKQDAEGLLDSSFQRIYTYAPGASNELNGVYAYDPVVGNWQLSSTVALTADKIMIDAAAPAASGDIILVGEFSSYPNSDVHGIMRIHSDGTVDNSFAAGDGAEWIGRVPNDFGFAPDVEGIYTIGNGDYLIAGDFDAFNGVVAPGIARMHRDGSVDSSFQPPVHRISERYATAAFLPQPDGSVLLSGPYSFTGENIERSLVRITFDKLPFLTSAVSRMSHANGRTYDIELPLSGSPGIESRSGGANGNCRVVLTFTNELVSGNASVSVGTATISGPPEFSGSTMTVNLTGVTNAQTIALNLSNVTNTYSQVLPDTTLQIGFLLGDVNGDGAVNSADVSMVRNHSGEATDSTNFRSDFNLDGVINSADALIVRSSSGSGL